MRKSLFTLGLLVLALFLVPTVEAAAPFRASLGAGFAVQRARFVQRAPLFRGVNAVRALGFGLGGFGYRQNFAFRQNFGLGLGLGAGCGFGYQQPILQPFAVQPVIQSYNLVQPFQAVQTFNQFAVTDGCVGCGAAQAVLGSAGCGGLGYGSPVIQPFFRQRFFLR